jgi:hypothetical protein
VESALIAGSATTEDEAVAAAAVITQAEVETEEENKEKSKLSQWAANSDQSQPMTRVQ